MAAAIENIDFPGGATATFSIIDTDQRLCNISPSFLLGPALEGFEVLPPLPSWSFLIESSTGKKALFDIGVSKNLRNYSPAVMSSLDALKVEFEFAKDVPQVLTENGVSLEAINSIVLSHHHYDHIGDPSLFPNTVEIVVGPGFKKAILPTYPENENGFITEDAFKGKTIREVSFDAGLKFGEYDAIDFFGDGSFYLLDTPGHSIGHLAGLVRTSSNPDTFAFLGGDLCHTTGQIRPSKYKPFPREVQYKDLQSKHSSICSASCFELMQTKRGRSKDEPLFDTTMGEPIEQAKLTLHKARLPDAQNNLLFLSAHDTSLVGAIDFFPKPANDWHAKGVKEKIFWAFINDIGQSVERYQ